MRGSRIWRYATAAGVPRRSAVVALIIGTVLNLINQGDALVMGAALNWFKILLTYAVPYGVATYGAVSVRLAADKARAAPPISSD
jgi:hypothetical protein